MDRRVLALTDDGGLAVQAPGASVLIESTNTVREAFAFCRKAQDEGLHLVMMNAEADKRRLDHRMCSAFTDGSKLNIEAALMANCCGGVTDVPGLPICLSDDVRGRRTL